MTNGEKFKEVFGVSQVDEGELYAFAWLPNHDAAEFCIDWWNAEYKEPNSDIRDNGVKDELNRVKDELGVASGLEKNSKLEKIRDQLKSNLRGVEITLEVLVENDPLRPKMEGAKTTLEDCLELIEQAEAESI